MQNTALKKFDYILFDWDGCLCNTLDVWCAVFREAYNEIGIFPDEAEVAKRATTNWKTNDYNIENYEEFLDQILKKVEERLKHAELNAGVVDLLKKLKSLGKKTAIASSSNKVFVEYILDKHELYEYFDLILCREDVENHKPHPEVINKAINLFNAPMQRTLMIGDTDADIVAGRASGISTVLYYPSCNELFYSRDLVSSYNADYMISDFGELLKIV